MRERSSLLLIAIGAVVRRERAARGWTQVQLAERAGIRVERVRDIEHGRSNPAFFMLDDLARYGLDMSLADLIRAATAQTGPRTPE